MDVYDTAAVQKIWQRVGLTGERPSVQENADLADLVKQELELAAFLQGSAEGGFARQASGRAAKLRAIHYVQTGQMLRRSCPSQRAGCLTADTLCQKIRTAQHLAQRYRQAMQTVTAYGGLFAQWVEQLDDCTQYLLKRLACLV